MFSLHISEKELMEKALIIEDDQDISNLISIHLSDLEFEVDKSFDGKEGLLKALNNTYKIIILDVRLPGLDGIEICKKLRADSNHVPVLILTAKSQVQDKVDGLDAGADDYLVKPVPSAVLVAHLNKLTRRTGVLDSLPQNNANLHPSTRPISP